MKDIGQLAMIARKLYIDNITLKINNEILAREKEELEKHKKIKEKGETNIVKKSRKMVGEGDGEEEEGEYEYGKL